MTAEEYVVEQIQRKDSIIKIRDDEIKYLRAYNDRLKKELREVLDLFHSNGDRFEASIWQKYDNERYKFLEELFNKYDQ